MTDHAAYLPLFAQAQSTAVSEWIRLNPWPTTVLVAVTAIGAVGAAALIHGNRRTPDTDDTFRHIVARSVLFSAIWGSVAAAALATLSATGKEVFTIILPVFSAWVGTLLAYYFGKDNYESGARNSAQLVRELGGLEKLRSIPVSQPGVMIPLAGIEVPSLVKGKRPADFASIVLKPLVTAMTRERLPLLDPDTGGVIAVLHKSLINDFLVRQPATKLDTVTLDALLADPVAGKIAKGSFACLPNTATLADVHLQFAETSVRNGVRCEDAFIMGSGGTRVEGWVTNDILQQHARV